jgi:hypothetical protein
VSATASRIVVKAGYSNQTSKLTEVIQAFLDLSCYSLSLPNTTTRSVVTSAYFDDMRDCLKHLIVVQHASLSARPNALSIASSFWYPTQRPSRAAAIVMRAIHQRSFTQSRYDNVTSLAFLSSAKIFCYTASGLAVTPSTLIQTEHQTLTALFSRPGLPRNRLEEQIEANLRLEKALHLGQGSHCPVKGPGVLSIATNSRPVQSHRRRI